MPTSEAPSPSLRSTDVTPRAGPLYGLLIGAGVAIAGLLGSIWFGAYHASVVYTPLLDTAVTAQLEATTGHLWFEEVLAGDREEPMEGVLAHYERARGYVLAMLTGGTGPEGTLHALRDEGLRTRAQRVSSTLAELHRITQTRYDFFDAAGPGSSADQQYDAVFRRFIQESEQMVATLRRDIADQYRTVLSTQAVLAATVLLLLAFTGRTFYRFGRASREQIRSLEAEHQRAVRGEARYRSLVENIDLGVTLIDADHRIVAVNAAQGRYFDREPGSFVGQQCFREFEKRDEVCPHCPGVPAMASGVRQTVETEGVRDDGSRLAVRIHAFPAPGDDGVPAGFIEVVEDITEQKRAEDELRRREATLQSVFRAAPVGIGLVANRVLGWTNERLEQMTGYTVDELLGKSSRLLYPDQEEFDRVGTDKYAQISELGTGTVETRWLRKDGRVIDVLLSSSPIDPDDLSAGVTFTALDITERKRAEEARLSLERQVQHAQKLESLGVLAGGIAHDFNNILMGVLGNAELALMQLPPENPVHENLHSIETAAVRAADLAKQMLAYSGKGRFVVVALDLNRVVEEMAHLLHTVISKNVVLKFHLMEDLPAVEADATQMRQVIMNLITNASEAIGERSGVVTVSTGVVEADRAYLTEAHLNDNLPEGYYTSVEVADTGCGMDRETREKIFDPFFTTKITGRGLGLAAVLGIVRGHKGAIKVYSEPGRGTTIKALFPCAKHVPATATDGTAPAPLGAVDCRGRGTILVVDDEESVRTVAKMTLEPIGFRILAAEDGREGLRVFQQHADEIAAVLLDMTMPHMGGEETFRELRRLRPDVRVILSSGYNEQSAISHFAGKGLAGFIQKPYRPSALIATLREILDDPRADMGPDSEPPDTDAN